MPPLTLDPNLVRCRDVTDDAELIARLRGGDEAAFVELVDRYHVPLLRLAQTFVPSRAVAEEVVQDTWLGVLRGIERFEGRSSLKTWLFRIVVNRARTTGPRERRQLPADVAAREPTVAASRFDKAGHWVDPPAPWTEAVDDRIVAATLAGRLREIVDGLPEQQRQVVVLRDVDGLEAAEVCELLDLSEGNQRVLLHRGRAKVRAVLDAEMVER